MATDIEIRSQGPSSISEECSGMLVSRMGRQKVDLMDLCLNDADSIGSASERSMYPTVLEHWIPEC